MQEKKRTLKEISTFLILTFGFSSFFYSRYISAGSLNVEKAFLYVLVLMWCPGVSAIFTSLIFQKNLRGLGWGWGKTRFQVLSFFLPFLYALPVYVVVWIGGWGGLDVQFSTALLAYPVAIFLSCLTALGEEIGWRGFLVSRLRRLMGFTQVSFLSGLIWAVWHMPLILFSGYNSGAPILYAALCFTIMVVGISFAFAWFRIKTGSVWTAMFLHAMHNYFIQSHFDRITVDTDITKYLTGEFGAGLALSALVVAYIFWAKRGRLSKPLLSATHSRF